MNQFGPLSPKTIKNLTFSLLERNSDIILTDGKYLTLLPVGHIARQIRINNHASRNYFSVEWRLSELYIRGNKIDYPGYGRPSGMVGRSIRYKAQREGGLWDWNDSTIVEDFTSQVEDVILSLLRPIRKTKDLTDFISEMYYFGYIIHRDPVWMSMTYALHGRLNLALQHWFKISPSFEERYNQIKQRGICDQQNPYFTYFKIGRALMEQDQGVISQILLEHERMEANNFKLGRHWQPTPFPFEESIFT